MYHLKVAHLMNPHWTNLMGMIVRGFKLLHMLNKANQIGCTHMYAKAELSLAF
jgi:hypothetical protein